MATTYLSKLIISLSDHDQFDNPTPPTTTIVLILISLSSLLIILSLLRKPKQLNLPPSPPGWPLIGNLHQLGPSLHRSFGQLSEKYGPVMLVHMGRAPTLVVSSVEAVKELVRRHDADISDRPTTAATRVVSYGNRNLGFAPFGEYWRQARRITVQELLSPKRVQHFQFVREEETQKLVERIRRICGHRRHIQAENSESVTGSDDQEKSINLSEMVLATANNVVARCIIGQSFAAEDGRNLAAEMVRKVMEISTAVIFLEDFMPWLRWVDVCRGVTAQLRSIFMEVDEFLDKVVEERETFLDKNTDNIDDNSKYYYLVDVLLKIKKDGSSDFELTRDNVKAFLLDLLTGGTDSTLVLLEWLMAELVRNPRAMKKVQEEVRRVVGKKSKIEANDINKMEYLKCVIKEALRLHPPGPLLAPREIINDIKILGFDVPAKTRLFVNAGLIQRDLNLWDRPKEFVPERFEANSAELRLGQDMKLIPFGFGRRGCAGLGFAVAGIEYLTANLLCWFDWELGFGLSPEDVDMSEAIGLLARKKIPLHLVPIMHSF